MSVQRRPNGTPYVRYRPQGKHGPQKSKDFPPAKWGGLQEALDAANAFDAKLTLDRLTRDVGAIAAAGMRLDSYAQEWFRDFAQVELARKTQIEYAEQWDRHLLKRVGHLPFAKCTTPVFEKLRQELVRQGLGQATIAKLLGLLQAMFREAVLWGYMDTNPLKAVPKRRSGQSGAPKPQVAASRVLGPLVVELMRAWLLEQGRRKDALLVCLLHYAGLRPGEALALDVERVLKQTLVIDAALSLGEEKQTKNRRNRSVRLLAPLRPDLDAYLLEQGLRAGLLLPREQFREGVITRGPKQGQPLRIRVAEWKPEQPWSDSTYRSWRRNVYCPVRVALGEAAGKPYDGRHSFASLLLHEGKNLAYVAEQLGDSIDTVQRTYLHVIEELVGQPITAAEETIRAARRRVASEGVRRVCAELQAQKAATG